MNQKVVGSEVVGRGGGGKDKMVVLDKMVFKRL